MAAVDGCRIRVSIQRHAIPRDIADEHPQVYKEHDQQFRSDINDKIRNATSEDPRETPKELTDVENGKDLAVQEVDILDKVTARIMLCMTAFGIHHGWKNVTEPENKTVYRKTSRVIVYNIIVLLLLWSIFIQKVVALIFEKERSSKTVMPKLTSICWHLQVSLNATIMIKASHPTFGNLGKAHKYYSTKILTNIRELRIKTYSKGMRRKILIGFVTGWCCILLDVASLITIFTLPPGLIQDTVASGFLSPIPVTLWTKILIVILHVFCSGAWILPVLYFIILATGFGNAFRTLEHALQEELNDQKNKNDGVSSERLTVLRMLHLDICKAVEIVDSDFKYLLANLCATSIPLACFIVYSLVKVEAALFEIFLYIFWLIVGDSCLIVASWFAVSLHESVSRNHSILNGLRSVQCTRISIDETNLKVENKIATVVSSSTRIKPLGYNADTMNCILIV